jgi:hypothetical protein
VRGTPTYIVNGVIVDAAWKESARQVRRQPAEVAWSGGL